MSTDRLFLFFIVRLLPLLVLALMGARAMAQADPPSRVARVNHAEGPVVFSQSGDNEWIDAAFNRPLSRGDRVWTDKGSRAELQVGSSAVRLNGLTQLEILALDDQAAQLSLTQGSVHVRVRSLPEGENFEIDTPNLAYRVAYPGEYRIDVDATRGTTRVTVMSGTGAVYGEAGQVLALGAGQQITFRARTLAQVAVQESPPQDNFDRWSADRSRREDQSVSARHVPREVVGYQQLDSHGQWAMHATYGSVWMPQGTPANWAPYRNGHWEWMSPWGWTWIDDAPWGFAPFHYGRWEMFGTKWGWVPGRLGLKPVYAPALVAFVGGGSGSSWNIPLVSGKPAVAWFPLAPGEVWQPGYRASPVYMSNLNQNLVLQENPSYANQRKAEALTSISAEDFHRGKPARAGWLRIAANTLTRAQIVPPPPKPEHGANDAVRTAAVTRAAPPASPAPSPAAKASADAAAAQAQKMQAAQAQAAQVQAQAAQAKAAAQAQAQAQALAQQQADALRQRQAAEQQRAQAELAQRAEQAKREEHALRVQQAKPAARPAAPAPAVVAAAAPLPAAAPPAQAKATADAARRAEQARADEQAKREKLARRTEQATREQVAKRAEQAKREQLMAKQAEQARREQVAKQAADQARQREQQVAKREQAKREQVARQAAEQAKREQVAKRAEQAKREQVAKQAEQARREAIAKREEQQRRELHAQHVEQARRSADRDAQVLREQRVQREELQAKRDAQEREQAQQREQAQRAAWARQQQALAEQWRRDQQALEQQQQQLRTRGGRPDLRDDRRPRGIPILNTGPMS